MFVIFVFVSWLMSRIERRQLSGFGLGGSASAIRLPRSLLGTRMPSRSSSRSARYASARLRRRASTTAPPSSSYAAKWLLGFLLVGFRGIPHSRLSPIHPHPRPRRLSANHLRQTRPHHRLLDRRCLHCPSSSSSANRQPRRNRSRPHCRLSRRHRLHATPSGTPARSGGPSASTWHGTGRRASSTAFPTAAASSRDASSPPTRRQSAPLRRTPAPRAASSSPRLPSRYRRAFLHDPVPTTTPRTPNPLPA